MWKEGITFTETGSEAKKKIQGFDPLAFTAVG
jgi:hypothetical protein